MSSLWTRKVLAPALPGLARPPKARAAGDGTRPASPLARRLLLLVAAVALPLLGLAAWTVWTAQDGVRARAEEALLSRVRALALAFERDFDRAWTVLDVLAASPALARGDLAAFEEEMRAASAVFGGAPVTLVAADGTIALSTLRPPGEHPARGGGGIRAPDAALRVIAAGRGEGADLFRAPLTGALSVAVGVPVFVPSSATAAGDEGGGRIAAGGVELDFPRDRVAAVLRAATGLSEADARAGRVAAVLDRSGVSIARTGEEEGIVGRPARPEVLARMAPSSEGILADLTTLDGVPVVTAFALGPRSGYRFVLTVPRAEFTAPLRAGLARTIGLGALVLAAGLGFAAMLARRTVLAFRAASAAVGGGQGLPPATTGLREADELARALGDALGERRRAEAALADSERRNREVLESLGEPLYALDAEGRVRFASRAALQAWGLPAEALLGRRFAEVFPQVAGSALWEAVRRAQEGREPVHLCVVSPILGRWVELDAYPSGDGGITVAFRDAEARRRAHIDRLQAERALRDSEGWLRLALDVAALGAWEVDLRSRTARRSARTLEIFGFSDEAETGAYPSWRDRIHPEDRAGVLETIEAACAGRLESYRVQYRFQRPGDDRWIWIESHGRVVERNPATGGVLRLAGTTQDITERQAAEAALGRFALIAEHVRDIVLFLRRDGRILEANAAAVAAYGHDRAALLGMSVRDLRAPETLPEVEAQMVEAEEGGVLFETWHRRADGTTFPVEVSAVGAEIAGERVLLSVIRDITQRKEAEAALAEGAARLRLTLEAGRMGSWDWEPGSGRLILDDGMRRLCGLPPEAGLDQFVALLHPADRPARAAALRRALAGDGDYRAEYRIRRADTGEERWLATRGRVLRGPDGRPARMAGVTFDVTESRAVEAALRESEARLRAVFDSGLLGLGIFDATTGEVLAVNDRALELMDCTREEFESGARDWRAATPPRAPAPRRAGRARDP